jgi:predicted ATPase with chaperone activity
MSKPRMTPQDSEAVEAARREFLASVESYDRVLQERRPIADVDEALKLMNEKQAQYHSLAEELRSYITDEGGS